MWGNFFYAQTVKGKVTSGGANLPGVSVIVQGTKNGTVTDFDGSFVLNNVEPKALLLFSYVGYKNLSIPADTKSVMQITMISDLEKLNEVVVIGYGTSKRKDINGAVSSIKASFGILSFNGNKIITTSSGGALITDSKKIKDKAIFYSNQSKDIAVHYQHSEIGYNYRMSNICAGIGLGQIKILDKNVEARRKNHFFYKEIFKEIENVELSEVLDETHFSNFWLNTILIKPSNNINKEGLRTALENANIESRPLWKPMHLQPIFCKYPYYGGKIAEGLFDNGLCLPSGSNLTIEDKDRIRKVIEEFFN